MLRRHIVWLWRSVSLRPLRALREPFALLRPQSHEGRDIKMVNPLSRGGVVVCCSKSSFNGYKPRTLTSLRPQPSPTTNRGSSAVSEPCSDGFGERRKASKTPGTKLTRRVNAAAAAASLRELLGMSLPKAVVQQRNVLERARRDELP